MTTDFAEDRISVHTHGEVLPAEAARARSRVGAALHSATDPVLFVAVRLTLLPDPALSRPAVAQVNVDLNGRLVRAQAARPDMQKAIDALHDKLRVQLGRAAGHWQAIRGGRPSSEPHEWRHTSVPTERPDYFPRPPEAREVVRHKAFSPPRITVDEAAFDMDMLDYDFHLFTEAGSGIDSVLYRTAEGEGRRLAQTSPKPERVTVGVVPFSVSPRSAPQLDVQEATDRLATTDWPFVFFRDAESGRGCVVYRRYDGHYGLITPPGV